MKIKDCANGNTNLSAVNETKVKLEALKQYNKVTQLWAIILFPVCWYQYIPTPGSIHSSFKGTCMKQAFA